MLWSEFNNFRVPDTWREFERMSRILSRFSDPSATEFPAVNVWKNSDDVIVTAEVPGLDAKDIDISVAGNALTLKGSGKPEDLKEGESYHRRERWYGQFAKTINLPFDIDADRINAQYSKGVLHIALPRAEENKPKKIEIRSE